MATANSCDLSEPHAPRKSSLAAYSEFENELKRTLRRHRRRSSVHDLPQFEAASMLSDRELTSFTEDDFEVVRYARVNYGHILFGKLRIPALADANMSNCYIHFRAFDPDVKSGDKDTRAKVHSIHTYHSQYGASYDACSLFTKNEPLEWFDT
jgi:hypothetical protein